MYGGELWQIIGLTSTFKSCCTNGFVSPHTNWSFNWLVKYHGCVLYAEYSLINFWLILSYKCWWSKINGWCNLCWFDLTTHISWSSYHIHAIRYCRCLRICWRLLKVEYTHKTLPPKIISPYKLLHIAGIIWLFTFMLKIRISVRSNIRPMRFIHIH